MTADPLAHRITTNPGQCGGRPCIRGMRIRVVDILDLLAAGQTHAEILADYPDLEPDDIRKVWEQMDTIDTAYGPSKMGGLETYGLRHAVVGPRSIAGLERGKPTEMGWIRDIIVP